MDDNTSGMDPENLGASPQCAESLQELYGYLDGELTSDRREHIREHLDVCLQCYEAFDFEAELRQIVSMRCREQVPESLRNRVADALKKLQDD